jgi:hypothetical protein
VDRYKASLSNGNGSASGKHAAKTEEKDAAHV